jgi:transcriptional regulatory protein AMDR
VQVGKKNPHMTFQCKPKQWNSFRLSRTYRARRKRTAPVLDREPSGLNGSPAYGPLYGLEAADSGSDHRQQTSQHQSSPSSNSHENRSGPPAVSQVSVGRSTVEEEQLTRSALSTFYESSHGPLSTEKRMAYVGTTASNLAHLINTRSLKPDCLHYPYPPYRQTLPWKPSASSSTPRAVPVIRLHDNSNLHEPPQWEFTTSPDPDLGTLPVREIRDELVDAYFKKIHPGFPVVEEAVFRRKLNYRGNGHTHARTSPLESEGSERNSTGTQCDDEPPPLLLIQCVLLAGAHVSNHDSIVRSRSSIKAALYHRARTLFDMRYENDRLLLCQAALILTWHTDTADDVSSNMWYWSGIACRIALGLGLHRAFASARLPVSAHRMMRRLWWLVVQTEVLCSLSYGRPVGFDVDDCDQPMLQEDDLIERTVDSSRGPIQESCTTNTAFCVHNASLSLIMLDILKLHSPGVRRRLGGDNSSLMHSARMNLNRRLAAWYVKLPADMANPGSRARSFLAAQLHLHYHAAALVLHRRLHSPSTESICEGALDSGHQHHESALPPESSSSKVSRLQGHNGGEELTDQSWAICHTSSLSILATVNHILASDWACQCWSSVLTSIFAAAIHFSSEVRVHKTRDVQGRMNEPYQRLSSPISATSTPNLLITLNALDNLQSMASIPAALATYWPAADGLSRLIETIATEMRTKIVVASSDDNTTISTNFNTSTNSFWESTNLSGSSPLGPRGRPSAVETDVDWSTETAGMNDGNRNIDSDVTLHRSNDTSESVAALPSIDHHVLSRGLDDIWEVRPSNSSFNRDAARQEGGNLTQLYAASVDTGYHSDNRIWSRGSKSPTVEAASEFSLERLVRPPIMSTSRHGDGELSSGPIQTLETGWQMQIDDLLRCMTAPYTGRYDLYGNAAMHKQ